MQRIPRGRGEKKSSVPKEVVFLQHGILADSTNWVMDSPTESLAYILADKGLMYGLETSGEMTIQDVT